MLDGRQGRGFRPALMDLEDRRLLATFTVTNTLDDNSTGSLRWAVGRANATGGADTIDFDSSVFATPKTILLTAGELDLTDSARTSITGPGRDLLSISGNDSSGVFIIDGTATLSGLTVTGGNTTGVGGGALNNGTLDLVDCSVSGNVAQSFYGGGGIYNNGTLSLTNCTVSGNSANYYGGGLYFNYGTATLTNCTISGNSATRGGGMQFWQGEATLTDCTVSDNTAANGGALHTIFGTVTLINSTISGNTATTGNGGGGVYNYAGTSTLINCTISGNTAFLGGGLLNVFGTATLTNNTISGNTASYGGGIYNYAGLTDLSNTIVAGNSDDIFGSVTGSHNLIGTGGSGGLVDGVDGNIVGVDDPGLGPLADNGGPTQTMALLTTSPALGAGSNDLAVDALGDPLTTDQRGEVRISGPSVDIGAYEFTVLPQTITFDPIDDQIYGATVTLTATASSGLPIVYTVVSGSATIQGDQLTVTGVGTLVIEASQPGGGAFEAADPVDISFDATPATLTITPNAGQSKVYGAAVPKLTVSASGFANGDGLAMLTGSIATTATASSPVGTYTYSIGTLDAGPNYILVMAADLPTFAVTPATLIVRPDAGQSKVYGADLPALTATATGFVNGDSASLLTGLLATTATAASPVGTYSYSLGTLDAGANYKLVLMISPPTFAVTPAGLTITPDAGQSKVYGAAVPSLTATASGFVNGDLADLVTGVLTTTATAKSGVGAYAYKLGTLSAGPNYTLILDTTPTFAVTPAQLTITPASGQSKVYGAAVPSLTAAASGFVNGDLPALLTGKVATTATASSPVGAYDFTLGTLDAGPNYTVALADPSSTFAVTPAPLTVVPGANQSKVYGTAVPSLTATASGFVNGDLPTLLTGALNTTATASSPVGAYDFTLGTLDAGPNYTLGLAIPASTFAITPAKLTVTPDAGQSKVYGAVLPTLTATTTGFVNGDTAALVAGSLFAVGESSPVGSYPFSLGSLSAGPNYQLTLAAGSPRFTVTPATLVITPIAVQATVYGSAIPALASFATGFVNGDTARLLTGGLGTTATSSSPVGTYPILLGTLSAGSNYTLVLAPNAAGLVVSPAPLVITANSVTGTAGQALPTLTAKYVGLVNGDTPASLATAAVLSTTATSASPGGTYAVTVSGASSPNYTITMVPGTLTLLSGSTSTGGSGASTGGSGTSTGGTGTSTGGTGTSTGGSGTSTGGGTGTSTGGTGTSTGGTGTSTGGGTVATTVVSASIRPIVLANNKRVRAIVLNWNAPINPADARTRAFFKLATTSANGKRTIQPLAIRKIQYQEGSTSLAIVTREPLRRNPPTRLTINATAVHDSAGNGIAHSASNPKVVLLFTKAGVRASAISALTRGRA